MSTRLLARAVCATCMVALSGVSLEAQTVKVVPKPNEGQWTISFSRKHAPGTYELDCFRATLDAAKERARALVAWSDGMDARSDWRLSVILIEGEDSPPKTPDLRPKPNRNVGDVLREYADTIKASYENARRTKAAMVSRVETVSKQQFDDVNRLIDDYNKQRDDLKARSGYFFSSAPGLARITPGELRAKIAPREPGGRYTVWVFKQIDEQWVKQDDRSYGTDDEEGARAYAENVNKVAGWRATSNVPGRDDAPLAPVAGRTASGRLNIRNFYVSFGTDGTLSAYTTRNTTEKPYTGRYTILNNMIEFEMGPSKFVGVINGARITGTRSRSDGINDDWELTLDQ